MGSMKDEDTLDKLSDGDEAVCAFFVENPHALRRVVQLMPHGNPTLDFLQRLYSFAVNRNRTVDLANALLGYDAKYHTVHQIPLGRDWFRECDLPGGCPEFFLEVGKYDWTRAELESGKFEDEDLDAVEAVLEWMDDFKKSVGNGIVDMDGTLTKIRLKRNGLRKALRNVH